MKLFMTENTLGVKRHLWPLWAALRWKCQKESFHVSNDSWEVVQEQMWLYRPVLSSLDIISYIQDLVMVADLKIKKYVSVLSGTAVMDEVQRVYLLGSRPIRSVSGTARLFSRTDPQSVMLTYIQSSAM